MRFLSNKWPVCNNCIFFCNCCRNDLKQRRLQFIKHQIFCGELLTMKRALRLKELSSPTLGFAIALKYWWFVDENVTMEIWLLYENKWILWQAEPSCIFYPFIAPYSSMAREVGKEVIQRITNPSSTSSSPIFAQLILADISRGRYYCCTPFRLLGKSPKPKSSGSQLWYIWARWACRDAENTIVTLNNIKLGAPTSWNTKNLLQLCCYVFVAQWLTSGKSLEGEDLLLSRHSSLPQG